MNVERLSAGVLILSLIWSEAICAGVRHMVYHAVIDAGFPNVSKRKLSKIMLKYSVLDAIFLLGLRRDAKEGRAEITGWCVVNLIWFILMISVPILTVIGFYHREFTWIYYINYVFSGIFGGFVVFAAPISSPGMRKTTSTQQMAIQGIFAAVLFLIILMKIIL